MIPPFIEYGGRRNGKQIERDIIGSILYSNDFMRERSGYRDRRKTEVICHGVLQQQNR
jgi:hypothetical protein